MGIFPRGNVEDDLRFDETNLEDFIESLQLAAERGEWNKEEKKKQLIAKSEESEKEEVKEIVEESRTWKRITAELWMTYTQARQDQTRTRRLQKKGLWIGREMAKPQRAGAEDEEGDDVPLKRLKDRVRIPPKSSNKGSDQEEGGEQKKEEAAEGRKKNIGASVVPRKRKLGKKRPIESGRKEVQERGSEKEGRVKEAGEGKTIQEGGDAPKDKSEEEGPIGDTEKEEMSEIRKKEDERDAHVKKMMRDMKEMREKMKELTKGKEELQKEVSQLSAALTMNDKKLENEAATIGRMKIKMDGLGSEVSVLGLDLDNEISERKKLGQEWEKRWGQILIGMEGLRLNH
ncbi:hypothetical protein CBR_g31294 [Chara braunii]|uniref:Uncharacterized protein n=1 Tax=Chara braunii TaxID=69332 RepID=A0A388LEK3_CHABU|nr:hypothetical protein CBR_g31294 [Chara braunii]|eukprot:GBG80739.1 hypothetical protein CBR_g31294 [Chara braunii]